MTQTISIYDKKDNYEEGFSKDFQNYSQQYRSSKYKKFKKHQKKL
jgi:hypothetical protein